MYHPCGFSPLKSINGSKLNNKRNQNNDGKFNGKNQGQKKKAIRNVHKKKNK